MSEHSAAASVTGVVDAVVSRYEERTPGSLELYRRARLSFPGGDTRTAAYFSPYPTFMERGSGSRIYDVDGNEYLDALNNFTSLVHGHANPDVSRAIMDQVGRSTAHGFPVERQIELAEAIKDRFPSVEMIRFANSGTEAVMMAIRAARAFTGRSTVVKMEGGFHGFYDSVRVSVRPSLDAPAPPRGTPDDAGLSPGLTGEVLVAPFNDLEATARVVRTHRNQIAAVIVEPVMGAAGMIPAADGFLTGLRDVTESAGVLLILDEVVTLRLGWSGGQGIHHVRPDLTCFGKVIGGGLPIGAFGGRTDIMEAFDPRKPEVIAHSGTYNGNAATMAAGIATLRLLTHDAIEHINRLGRRVREGFQRVLDETGIAAHVTGAGSLVQVHFTPGPVRDYRSAARADRKAAQLVHLTLLNSGVVSASRGMFVMSTVMEEADADRLVQTFETAIRALKPALESLPSSGSFRTLSTR